MQIKSTCLDFHQSGDKSTEWIPILSIMCAPKTEAGESLLLDKNYVTIWPGQD